MNRLFKYALLSILLVATMISSPVRNGIVDLLEDKPISGETLLLLRKHESMIAHYAEKYDIPQTALASAIGSEMNRRIYINKWLDWIQDRFFASPWCSEGFLAWSSRWELDNRYVNFSKQDIGLGNIKFSTAWEMSRHYPKELTHIHSHREMADYLLTAEGNIHVAALVIRRGRDLFCEHYAELGENHRNAVLYSYYKQGHSFYDRYRQASAFKRPPIPGGGEKLIVRVDAELFHD